MADYQVICILADVKISSGREGGGRVKSKTDDVAVAVFMWPDGGTITETNFLQWKRKTVK